MSTWRETRYTSDIGVFLLLLWPLASYKDYFGSYDMLILHDSNEQVEKYFLSNIGEI